MSTYEANSSVRQRAPRLWIIEFLIVVGVLAFGYFAITMDSSLFTGKPAAQAQPAADPFAALRR